MILRKIYVMSLLLVAGMAASAQKLTVAEGYYGAPMDIRMLPSANFAETRPNHFHSGVDIKIGGVEGEPLKSAADGYVSRISVSPGGYGRALYINHPNGTMTVYAHMQKFAPEIEAFVASQRYSQKMHSGDFWPTANKLPLKKGQYIGNGGNSGSSAGPHLHFEVRETASQMPVNVFRRGYIEMKDDIPPRIVNLYYIEVDTVGIVPVFARPRLIGIKSAEGNKYVINGSDTVSVGPRGYFVIEVTDRKNDSHNTMGIYSVDVAYDGSPIFGFELDGFLFTQTRYVNSLMQYDMQSGSRNQLLRLAVQTNNKLPIFRGVRNRGLLVPADDEPHRVEIKVEDDNFNASTLAFYVRKRTTDRQIFDAGDVQGIPLDCTRDFSRSTGAMEVTIPAGTLYESIFYEQREDTAAVKGRVPRFSALYTVHNDATPMHSAMTLSIRPDADTPASLYPKLCFGALSKDNSRYSYAGGRYEGGRVVGSLRAFGRYCVVADTIAPKVTCSFIGGADLSKSKSIYVDYSDDFSGVASFGATIDGQWIAFDQTRSGGRITHYFASSPITYNGGTHRMEITVTDNVGNSTTLIREFTR